MDATPNGLVERVDLYRISAFRRLDPSHRAEIGQFLTPPAVARFMASLFGGSNDAIRLLDFQAVKNGTRDQVTISTSHSIDDDTLSVREVSYDQVVHPDDPGLVIHIAASEMDAYVKDRVAAFDQTLNEIGLGVSTGRVVDFRARDALRCSTHA